ncbi:hypothetical protein FHS04_000235 [Mesoflavibacter sabulilitoris]|uniref:DUF3575 domain-containing protein n=1 Tax=Mesoflavibacter zeaxanthinifaciens subsp. sabulilitoris TaxID=1520893 RepID=A0A2T1NH16_9FLAO|nr:hypothetical protein [Mesoflavibacter zeaxanthinifaciens]MBB3122747.1 hypothetical protein [Mesoflavibacter zeaxanthinifaciens subsp. sabulilitoris]PSG92167.1 hypothetical protein C7H61_06205 [Mesoflavibacter zeaxanthinifaciens subsp. sabulilitoris]
MKKLLIICLALFTIHGFAQQISKQEKNHDTDLKYRVSFPAIILGNIGKGGERTNTQHIELHVKRELDAKNIVGFKFATWRLFQPMGIQWWDGLKDKIDSETEFYPGYLRETGIGISYQRMLWKGLFASVEVLPLYKTYLDLDDKKITNGFKLYNSYHIGYHFAFGKKKQFFIEPQFHCNVWHFDTNTPDSFKQLDNEWDSYFLFEPNLYIGIKF